MGRNCSSQLLVSHKIHVLVSKFSVLVSPLVMKYHPPSFYSLSGYVDARPPNLLARMSRECRRILAYYFKSSLHFPSLDLFSHLCSSSSTCHGMGSSIERSDLVSLKSRNSSPAMGGYMIRDIQ